jgi:carboxymethylenebutenolidase
MTTRYTWRVLFVLPFLAGACVGREPKPPRLTSAGISPGVWGVLAVPRTAGAHPAVVLLPGSFGWRADYAQFAQTFADSGFVALALDYYAETGRGISQYQERRNWPIWQSTVRNAVAYLDTLPVVSRRSIGLVGYSRGAFLAISVADSLSPIRAVVDFYGGGSDDDPPESRIPSFPPLLILHGEADSEIPVTLAHRLFERLHDHGGDVEMHLYPGAEHVFNGPWASTYSPADAADAWSRSIAFLRRKLTK